jgi:glucokinase
MSKVIGVDLGASNVRAGVVSGSSLKRVARTPLGKNKEKDEVLGLIYSLIDKIIDPEVKGIGVGVPSVVDTAKGIVYNVINIPSWKKVYLKKLLEDRYKIPVKINNDANCFVLGEKYFGKGKSSVNLIGLTIGTGLGAGIIINNKLYEGVNCGAGEFGMIPFKDDVIETYCSGQFFDKCYNLSAAQLLKSKNNTRVNEAFSMFGKNLAEAIKIIMYSYDPGKIILGGSVSNSFPLFSESMWNGIKTFPYKPTLRNLKIEVSGLKYPGILGAAALFNN